MREITFVTANNPNKFIGGDARLTRLIISGCAEIAKTKIVTLDDFDDYSNSDITSVKKSSINLGKLLLGSLKSGNHPIFIRYNSETLRRALLENQSDFYIGEHLYMSKEIQMYIFWSPECNEGLVRYLVKYCSSKNAR